MPKWGPSLSKIPVSYPIKVLFQGFESDTVRLQQAGWEISARQAMDEFRYCMTVQLAMRNRRLNLHAVTTVIRLDGRMAHFAANGAMHEIIDYFRSLYFEVIGIGSDIEFQSHSPAIRVMGDFGLDEINLKPGSINYFPVDTRPQWIAAPERFKLSDLCLFRKVDGVQEFLVDQASVDDLMNLILKKQAPKQKEIRERARRAEFKREFENFQDRGEIKAQLIVAG